MPRDADGGFTVDDSPITYPSRQEVKRRVAELDKIEEQEKESRDDSEKIITGQGE